MVFRHLAQAIRAQSWFTVVLEVAIVVVGILIGLEVDDWNQTRLNRDNDRRVLALFIDELEYMRESAASDLDVSARHLQDLSEATRIALSCDATDDEHALLATIVVSSFEWRAPNIKPSGLAEISNSGTLERIGDPAFSQAVGGVNQTIKFMNDSINLFAPGYHRAVEMVLPHLKFNSPIMLHESDGLIRASVSESLSLAPQEEVCKSQEFLLGLSELASYYDSLVYVFGEWHQSLDMAHRLATDQAL